MIGRLARAGRDRCKRQTCSCPLPSNEARLIESWLSGTADFEVVMCSELLGEVREVLTTRPRLRKWISLEHATLFVDTIAAIIDLVDDPK